MTWLKDPTPAGLLLYLTILALVSAVAVLMAAPVNATPPVVDETAQNRSSQASEVEAMILHLVKIAPRHPMNRADWGAKMAEQIVIGADRHGAPTDLVTVISYRESSFRWKVIGPGGEEGIMQVHPGTIRKFKCDMSTVAGQIDCGCKVLAWHYSRCGTDWRAALAAYGSKTAECNPKPGSKLRAMVDDRFDLARKLREITGE